MRLFSVSAIALALPVPGSAALCEQIQATEQEVESLRANTPTLKADVAAKKQRLANVRSWMPDAEAQERLAAARTAYVEAKANEQRVREERRLIESQAGDLSRRKRRLILEKESIKAVRVDVESPRDSPEVRELRKKVKDHESYARSRLGGPPSSASEARAMALRVAGTSHLGWLQEDDLSVFAREEFTAYRRPSYTGADRSRLTVLERDLESLLHQYGGREFRMVRGAEAEASIHGLAERIRSLRMEAAQRLTQLAADLVNLQEAIQRTGKGVKPARQRGSEAGFLSAEARQRRIAEIESQVKELEETEQRLLLELQARNQELADVALLREELQSVERVVRGAHYEVRDSDRHDLAEAEQELDEATTKLVEAEERLPLATREVSRLRRLLNEKVAGINTIIAEAKPISGRAAAHVEAGRFQQCAFLRSSYIAALRQARGQCEEEAACLASALPGMPDEISTLIASIDAVDCGYTREYPDTDQPSERSAITTVEPPRRQQPPAPTEVADNPFPATRGVTANRASANPGPVQEPVCSGCMVSETTYGSGLVYLFEAVRSVRNAICSNGSVRSYELFMLNPDRDDDGKPLPRSEQAERYAQSKATMTGARVSKLCGPCSSQQEARLMMRNRCPNPNGDIQSGPGGIMLDSRRGR